MATQQKWGYTIILAGVKESTRDHYHSVAISDLNAHFAKMPKDAIIKEAYVYLKMRHKTVFGTLGNADLNIWLCNNGDDNSGQNLLSGQTSTSTKKHKAYITNLVNKSYPFNIQTSYSRLAVYYDSTTSRTYYCDAFEVYYVYELPDKTNKIYVGTAQPKAIFLGTTPVKALHVGTTKVYG